MQGRTAGWVDQVEAAHARDTAQLVILRESGGSSTPRPLDPVATASGILGRPVKPDDDDLGDVARARAMNIC